MASRILTRLQRPKSVDMCHGLLRYMIRANSVNKNMKFAFFTQKHSCAHQMNRNTDLAHVMGEIKPCRTFCSEPSKSSPDELHSINNNVVEQPNNTGLSTVKQVPVERALSVEDGRDIASKAIGDMEQLAHRLEHLKPAYPKKSFSLAPFVNDSETLSTLVKHGVDLSKVEKVSEVASYLVTANFDRDCMPYFLFLHSLGIGGKQMGRIFSKNPRIFKENIEDLEVRISYLQSKKFDASTIKSLVEKFPNILCMATKEVDTQLGYLQKEFQLSGKELREMISKGPKLVVWRNRHLIRENKIFLKDLLGFNEKQIKEMQLKVPMLAISDSRAIRMRYDYLHDVVGLTNERIVEWPNALRLSLHRLKERHKFLKTLGKAQYNPDLPNFIPLVALMHLPEEVFCGEYAKVSVQQFDNFLKTL